MLHSPSERGLASGASRSPFCRIRRTIGEYNFAGQHQQSPAPLGGGLVKAEWFVFRANETDCSQDVCALYTHARSIRRPTGPPDGLR
jgi:hypothetical protein